MTRATGFSAFQELGERHRTRGRDEAGSQRFFDCDVGWLPLDLLSGEASSEVSSAKAETHEREGTNGEQCIQAG
jgi:hypothetical protein